MDASSYICNCSISGMTGIYKVWNTLFLAWKNFGHQSSNAKTSRHGNESQIREASGNAGQDCQVSNAILIWATGSETSRNPDSDGNHFRVCRHVKTGQIQKLFTKSVFHSCLVFPVLKHQTPLTACMVICNHLGSLKS